MTQTIYVKRHVRRKLPLRPERTLFIEARNARTARRHVQRTRRVWTVKKVELSDSELVQGLKLYKIRIRRRGK